MSSPFQKSFEDYLKTVGVGFTANEKSIFAVQEKNVVFQLIPTSTESIPNWGILDHKLPSFRKIIIHEDLWITNNNIIASRINQLFGLNQKIGARKCELRTLEKSESEYFLENNHLLGSCNAAYRIGLFYKDELLAVSSFSKSRVMVDGTTYYRSFEMLRFAVKIGYSITGGLGKLLNHFIESKNVVHLMTYIDNEWGNGEAYLQLGFKATSITEPQTYWIDAISHKRTKNIGDHLVSPNVIEKEILAALNLY